MLHKDPVFLGLQDKVQTWSKHYSVDFILLLCSHIEKYLYENVCFIQQTVKKWKEKIDSNVSANIFHLSFIWKFK